MMPACIWPGPIFWKNWAWWMKSSKNSIWPCGTTPTTATLYPRLAEIYQDLGRPDRAAHVWAARVKQAPRDAQAYRLWGELLREQGDHDHARQVFQEGLAATGDPAFTALLRDLDTREQEPLAEEGLQAGPQLLPGRHHLVTFTALFRRPGRRLRPAVGQPHRRNRLHPGPGAPHPQGG